MNNRSSQGHVPRVRGAGALAAVALGLGLVTAACSSNPSTTASSAPPTYAQMVAYADCIRTHGDPAWPDPVKGPAGIWTFVSNGPGSGVNAAGAPAAMNACKKLAPQQSALPAYVIQAARAEGLKLAACMRAHGITNYPDPVVSDGGIGRNLQGIDTSSPQYETAQQACRAYEPAGAGGSGK